MKRPLTSLAGPLLLAVFPLLVFPQLWAFGPEATGHFQGDTTGSYWPDLVYLWRSFAEGQFPLWNPHDRGGFPFAADPQPGVLYPVNWLLAGIGLLLGELPYAVMQAKVLLHLAGMGLAMYAFLRGRGLPRLAAVAGGLLYQLGPFVMENGHFSLIWPLVWLPLALLAVDRLFADDNHRPAWAAVGLGLASALVLVAGSPPAAFYAALVGLPYFALRFVQALWWERGGARRFALPVLLAFTIAVVLALPQFLGTWQLMGHSVLAEPSFAHAARGSVPAKGLLGLLLPVGYQRFLYVGLGALFLAGLGFWRARRRDDAWFFLSLAVVSVLLLLGENGPLLRPLCAVLPPFEWFRLPFRYVLLLHVAVPVLVAGGVASLLRGERRARRVGAVATWLWLLLVGNTALLYGLAGLGVGHAVLSDLWLQALLFGLLLVCLWVSTRRDRLLVPAVAILVAVLATDLALHAQRTDLLRKGAFTSGEMIAPEALAGLQAERRDYRIWDEFRLHWRAGSRLGLRDFRGYMDPLRLARYKDVVDRLPVRPELVQVFGVRHILQGPHPYLGSGHRHVKRPAAIPGARREGPGRYVLRDAAPRAWWVGAAARFDDAKALLAALTPARAAREALLLSSDLDEPLDLPPGRDEGGSVAFHAARVLAADANTATYEIEAPAAGLLVVNEAWFPGWQATVNGAPARIVRANHLVQAVVVPAGRHEVHLAFRPAWFLWPARAALALLLSLALAGVVAVWRRHRASR